MASPAQASETGSTAAVAVAAGHAARCRTSQTVAMPGSRTWDQQPATFDELDVLHAAVTLPRVTATFDSIRTERLLMRRWRDSDRGPFAAMNADPEVMHFFPEPLDRAASDAYLDRIEALFQRQGFGLWALEQVTTGRFLGFTGLNPMPPGVPGAGGMEVGWRLARHAWHQGFATEAATAALDVAFRGVGLAEVWSMTAVLNEPSQAVMRRLGMKLHGHFEHPRVEPGHPLRPHVAYRITRSATV